MSRRYDLRDILRYVNFVEKYVQQTTTGGDTTTNANALIDATTVTVASPTNFAANDPIFLIGPNQQIELNAIASIATNTFTLAYPLSKAFASGGRVVEAQKIDLGPVDESGVTLTGSGQIQDILAATSRLPIASFFNNGQLGGSFNLRGFNIPNLQTVFGIPEKVQGTGATATPFRAMLSGQDMGTEGLLAFRARAIMGDALTQALVDFCGVTAAPNVNTQLGGTNPATLGVQFRCQTVVPTIWT